MVPVALLRLSAAAAALCALPALGHDPGGTPLAQAWNLDPWVSLPLAASAVLYAAGLARLWARAGPGRGVTRMHAARFGGGWLLLAVALVSPLDALGESLFSAHMVQHEVLMTLAAPLLVMARPLEAWTWGLAPAWRTALRRVLRVTRLQGAVGILREPLAAWTLHAAAVLAWHVPAWFALALRDPAIHALQHASFLGTALLFWWSVLGHGVHRAGVASVASLFTTMMYTGGLGALLTFAPSAWYSPYALTTARHGLTPLEDQQLGGLVMSGPGALPYLAAGLAIVGAWLARGRAVRLARAT
jgi:putative membrane protein